MVVEKAIVRLKKDYPSWGAPKLRERLKQKLPEVGCPAISTVHAVLGSPWPRETASRRVRPRLTGHDALAAARAQRAVVRRL